jgi:CxxC motif-containing protein
MKGRAIMMEKRELTCINCPMGCTLSVEIERNEVIKVTGHTCPKGETYAHKEITSPTRIVTSTIPVRNGSLPVVSVKTSCDIPKNKIRDCITALRGISVTAPVHIGDIILSDVAGTGSSIIATKNINLRL